MPDWAAFAGMASAATLLLLAAARLSASAVDGSTTDPHPAVGRDDTTGEVADADPARPLETPRNGADHADGPGDSPVDGPIDGPVRGTRPAARTTGDGGVSMTTPQLVANVAFTHGLFGVGVLVAAWYTGVPASAFGWAPTASALVAGVSVGALLSVVNAGAAAVSADLGYRPSSELRELLAPDSRGGWLVLLGVVLPVVAGFEELLFRGVLVGAFAVGFGLSPWPLAVASSVAFALAHAAQGRVGMVVTGALGFALATAFVLTGSLLAVVVAHYLVNVVEFAVHEWLDVDVPWD